MCNSYLEADYPIPAELETAIEQAIHNGQKLADKMNGEDSKAITKMMDITSDYKKGEKDGKNNGEGFDNGLQGGSDETL
ncbi:hypothetical protein RO21_11635 [[Actinobacillus] muris]|uniref:Uncharacterized protein n=2 Tax=Muribacter muris TaxID=67855 RepID=A0A0J5P2I5_9PAST|nr:hypothetical protein RO21_11635 [[Actinobacillus] muris] [Muribacter muris]